MPWLNPLLPIILSISQAPLLVKLALTIFSSINWFSTFPWWPLVFLKLQTFQLLWHSRRTDHQTQRTRQQPLNSRLPQSSKRVRRHIVYVVTCRLRPTSAFHVTRTDPGTEAYEGLRNGLRVDLPVTFDAAPLDCAAGGVSAHLSSWQESKPIPRRRLRDLRVEVRLLDRLVDTLCSVETDFNLLTLLVYLFYEYKVLSKILWCDAKRAFLHLGTGP